MSIQIKHCCERMDFFLKERKVAIGYAPKFRQYHINLMGSSGVQNIVYCPWCGTKLPEESGDRYFAILERDYGIDDPFDYEQSKKLPEEFKTDEWWKKKGL